MIGPFHTQCTGTVIVIIGFAVVGPAPYLGMEANYSMVCAGLTVSKMSVSWGPPDMMSASEEGEGFMEKHT